MTRTVLQSLRLECDSKTELEDALEQLIFGALEVSASERHLVPCWVRYHGQASEADERAHRWEMRVSDFAAYVHDLRNEYESGTLAKQPECAACGRPAEASHGDAHCTDGDWACGACVSAGRCHCAECDGWRREEAAERLADARGNL
jgi:hypothetical protein